ALEPVIENRKLFEKENPTQEVPVTFVEGSAEGLPFPDGTFDCVVTTWTLCTIANVEQALREIERVLKPNGKYFFIEHGRSTDPKTAKWQDRLTPLQRRIAGGCHLNRPIDALVRKSGLTVESLETFQAEGPRLASFLYKGVARR